MHKQQLDEARALATPVPHVFTVADGGNKLTSPLMVVQYVPSLGDGGSTATMSVVAATGITVSVDSASPTAGDRFSWSGLSINFGARTVGAVLDAINSQAAYRAYLVGGLRADTAAYAFAPVAGGNLMGANGLTLYANCTPADETSASKHFSFAISGEKFVNTGVNGWVKDSDDKCENVLTYLKALFTWPATNKIKSLKFYSASQSAETQIAATVSLSSTTATELGEESLDAAYIQAKRGERLVVRFVIGSITTGDANAIGKTAVLANNRVVTEDNY